VYKAAKDDKMRMSIEMKVQSRLVLVLALLSASSVLAVGFHQVFTAKQMENARARVKPVRPKSVTKVKTVAKKLDWHQPSMSQAYPKVQAHPNLQIEVSTVKQRVYLRENGKVLYTMLASTGRQGDETPKGQFQVQAERGLHFYNAESKEGANYWVSFKDHGIYLFHSVPVDASGKYVTTEAEQLGKVANSHGCVRLTIADAKWLYENIRQNTPVTVS